MTYAMLSVLANNHESVTKLYNEWFGIGPKQDKPCLGGFEALDVERKSLWRKGYHKAENQRFSKLKRIIDCVKKQQIGGRELLIILGEYDGWWKQAKSNPTNMIELLQSKEHYAASSRKSKKRPREEDLD
jgi:hypothetical protein